MSTGRARIVAFIKALGRHVPPGQVEAVVDLLCHAAATMNQGPRRLPVVLWRAGRRISGPRAWIQVPPPAMISVTGPLIFRSIEEVVEHLTGDPVADKYVLQYIATEPRAAVYLYAPEALAQMESA